MCIKNKSVLISNQKPSHKSMSILRYTSKKIREFYNFVRFLIFTKKVIHEDTLRKKFILNILSLGIATFLLILLILSIQSSLMKGANYMGVPAIILILFIIVSLFSFLLSNNGRVTLGSVIILLLIYTCVFYGSAHWGADLPTVLIALFITVLISGILINSKAGLTCAIILSIHLGLFNYMEDGVFLKVDHNWKNNSFNKYDVIEYSSLLIFASLFSWLSNDQLEKSLRRSREAEIKLQIEKDSLEKKVSDRTEEIKKMQIDKINSMYRMVEFGRISSGLFHDIINPLTNINLNLQAFKIKEAKDLINQLIPSIKKIETLISQSKKYIKLDNIYTFFDPKDEILSVIGILKYKSDKNRVSVLLEDNYKTMKIYGSQTLFSHIIMNLVSNGIDSHDRALNPIFSDKKERCFVLIKTRQNLDNLIINVVDNGIGMDKSIMDNIFDPFYTTKKEHGCGIGLSATKHILKKYFNGEIEVESDSQKGTIFTVNIPLNYNKSS